MTFHLIQLLFNFGPVPVKNNKFHQNFLKATIINYCSSFNFDLYVWHLRQSLYFNLVGQLDRFMIWNARFKPLKITYSDIVFYILKASQLGYVLLHVPLYIYCQFNYRVLRFPTASNYLLVKFKWLHCVLYRHFVLALV